MITDISIPIIGADFLEHYGLMVDLKGTCLIDRTTFLSIKGEIGLAKIPTITLINDRDVYTQLLAEYKEILTIPDNKPITTTTTRHQQDITSSQKAHLSGNEQEDYHQFV